MSLQIFLDNYNNACYPGQTISGRIECMMSETKKIRAVVIKFKGIASTSWTESERYYDDVHKEERSRDVTYTAEEVYFYQEYNLLGGAQEVTVPAGTHAYPFSYILPPQLPSSFESYYGTVRYNIKAKLDCPWQFDPKAEVILNLVSPLDLNFLPRIREPVEISVDKTMCSCWCNDAGALTFTISLPVTGYTPGQEVRIGAYVENLTNVTAEKVNFRIIQLTEHIARFPSSSTKHEQATIVSCVESGVGAHAEKSWTSVLAIPTDRPFPNMIPCSIINITYRLEAEITVPCPHTNLSTDLPLMIGNVPLTQADIGAPLGPPQQTNGYSPYPNPTAPSLDSPLANPTAPYPVPGNFPYQPGNAGDSALPPAYPAVVPNPPPQAGWVGGPTMVQGAVVAPPSYEEVQQSQNKDGNPT